MRYALTLATTLAVLLALSSSANATPFSGNNVNLVGNATVLGNGDLQLTSGANYQDGAAWLAQAFSTADSFDSRFSFSLANAGYNPMADGFAFVMQNNGTAAIGAAGGNVGYNGLSAVGSVVQTWYNNHVGLNIDGNAYNTKAAPTDLGHANLITGTEDVSYNATTNMLGMTGNFNIDGTHYLVNDSAMINLALKFGPSMNLGFTGATGGSYADERITSFSVTAVPEPTSYAMLLAGLGLLGFMARRKRM